MDFINSEYNSGIGKLFQTEEYPNKNEVTFDQFMRYLNQQSAFEYTESQYRQQMEILDQEGDGKEAQIEDIRRVLGTYSNLDETQINKFLEINQPEHADQELKAILNRISSSGPDTKLVIHSNNQIEKGTINIDKSVQLMFPKYNL